MVERPIDNINTLNTHLTRARLKKLNQTSTTNAGVVIALTMRIGYSWSVNYSKASYQDQKNGGEFKLEKKMGPTLFSNSQMRIKKTIYAIA